LTPKELEFWTRVRYRNEKLQEQIRIRRRREFATAIMPPAGSPPFAYRPAFRIAGRRPVSQAEIDEARQLFRHRNAIHRADEPYSSVEEYACGVYRLEMREAREKAFARSCWTAPVAKDAYARTYMDGLGPKADSDNGAAALGAWQQGPQPISHDEWRARGYSVSSLLDALTLSREDRELLARVLAKSPGKSRGRPPMIVRERKRPGRPNWKQPKPTPAAPLQLAKSRRHGS
jgi:hypothetical protein